MSMLDKFFPPELTATLGVMSNWFTNSGISEQLETAGTTGVHSFKTTVNGKPAIVSIGVSYLSEEQSNQIDGIIMSTFAEEEGE